MDFVDQLKKEKESLLHRVGAINLLLESYGVKTEDTIIQGELFPENQQGKTIESVAKVFPINGNRDKQVLWLFENYLEGGIKIKKAEEHYEAIVKEYGGRADKITNVARRLKTEGRLVAVRYNNNNGLTFWGLPSWVEENDFKKEFYPNENELPLEIKASEVTRD